MTLAHRRGARLEARIAPELHATLKRAAEIEGRSLTDFVVSAASAAARRTLEDAETIRLSGASAAFVAGLLQHPSPLPGLITAKKRRDALFGEE